MEKEYLPEIDGLRGLAVGMVLLYHTWAHATPGAYSLMMHRAGAGLGRIAMVGYQGVSLFLVLSGFCLAYPAYRRRLAGKPGWFRLGAFIRARCWRILPPYYVALALFTLVNRPAFGDLVAHLALAQNLTVYITSINGSFWSLGLEWQWYACFPLVLLLVARWPRATLAGLLGLAVGWQLTTGDLWGIGAPPARLFEFGCGVVTARLTARGVRPHPLLLGMLAVAALALAEWSFSAASLGWLPASGLQQPLYGMAFAAFLLLALADTPIRRYCRMPWLVGLGVVSYSVYLVHEPVISILDAHVIPPLALGGGLAAGIAFYALVEWPILRLRRGTTSMAMRGPQLMP